MSEAPILKDTNRSTGRDALQKNIQAALALSGAIRSTLGPRGLDKLLIDDDGRVLVTNDGVTVLETAKVEHPVAKMMINASSTQDRIAKDGTTTTVVLAGEMLQNAWELILQGIHPATIARGFRNAEQFVLSSIEQFAISGNEDLFYQVISTSLSGKGHTSMQNRITELSLEAIKILDTNKQHEFIDSSKIKIISQTGGQIEESYLVQGLALPKKRMSSDMPKEINDGKILLIDGGLEFRAMATDVKLNVTSAGVFNSFREKITDAAKKAEKIKQLGVNVVACREGIDDSVKKILVESGIQAYRRVAKSDLNLLAKACNGILVNRIEDAGQKDLGNFESSNNISADGKDLWVLSSTGGGVTIVAKGSTVDVVGEVERCLDDALGVAIQLYENNQILCGGGATYVALARALRRFAESVPGREQLAIEAFADAIEVVVRILAENAGQDPIACLLDVVAQQANLNSAHIGIDLNTGKSADMKDLGVLEPIGIVKQAIIGATEVSISVLRIDDVLWAKQDVEIPDLAE